jgi:SAM-dependent methyltransferase
MDETQLEYQRERIAYWNSVAADNSLFAGAQCYRKRLQEIYQTLVQPGSRIIEIGCGHGDLLAALDPSRGVGVDFSEEMIVLAAKRYPHLSFIEADAHELQLNETFDFVIISDLLNDLWDVQTVFDRITHLIGARSRIVINFYSRVWQVPLDLVRWLGLARPALEQNWLAPEDIANVLYLCRNEIVRQWSEILFPLEVPIIAEICNRFLVKVWPFRLAALTNFIVARPRPTDNPLPLRKTIVSVVVPARNEAGNIPSIFQRVPEMGDGTELVFVEGHSLDETYDAIRQTMTRHPERRCKLLRQEGTGKGDAVRLGFNQATGNLLMILDADLTVPPEILPRFYEALISGKGEFINGVRLVYPMEHQAMRFLNLVGNKFFSLAFSWLLGQPIKDTLCGTKALFRDDYDRIAANRSYFGDFDPFGDFDLIFGAAKLNLKIVDIPIRYRERTYGATNIQRWRHGLLLLEMVLFAARKIKFL